MTIKMSILGTVKLTDVPVDKAPKFSGNATIAKVETKEAANDKVQINIVFDYTRADGSEASFTDRGFVKPEWFSSDYVPVDPATTERGTQEYKDAFGYQLNVSKKYRKIFHLLGLESIDFDQLEGRTVGIVLGPESDKRDPSRQELKSVFAPKA